MTFISYQEAEEIVDRFIGLLARHSINPPPGSGIEAELLSIVQMLQPGANPPTPTLLPIGGGILDLAAKLLAISTQPEFNTFTPHLQLFASNAPLATAVQTMPGQPTDDVHRKLNELYLGSLAVHLGHKVELDHPSAAVGDNPDVLFDLMSADGTATTRWALAIKTISTQSGQTIFERIQEASQQINAPRCPAERGMVVINTQGSLNHSDLWTARYGNVTEAITAVKQQIKALVDKAHAGRPISDWVGALYGKASPVVLYIGHAVVRVPTAISRSTPTVIKVAVTDQPSQQPDQLGMLVADRLNHYMQTINRGVPGGAQTEPS
ncbi:conserved hypothetical protein [Paraburkholderia unamae]|uniref:hypothetical protein n=1 Tax=Paraburkholderia unamae TaxID=219649 RepID=UPI001CB31D64|nr:hypothetical protein [Paraburkholderia unamae]CAG9273475.1 conserved hypothetical protein [Paraburkholderia unamae]